MTINTTRRGAIATVAGGAVALTGAAAAYAYKPSERLVIDPVLEIAAEWTKARDNLLELLKDMRRSEARSAAWRANAIALTDASDRLSQIAPTTLAGAAALLAIAVFTLQPDGLVRVHHGFIAEMPMLDWLRNVHAVINNGRAS